jgi:hypothetical protein
VKAVKITAVIWRWIVAFRQRSSAPREFLSRRHVVTEQPADTRFQRPSLPLRRVTDNGATSMRQNDFGGAPVGVADQCDVPPA